MNTPIQVLLVEDHAGYREVISRTIQAADQVELLKQFGTAEIALREIQCVGPQKTPDVILLDLNLPGMSGIEAIPWFKKYLPEANVIILTQSDQEQDVLDAIALGASGYLLKSSTAKQVIEGIQIVAGGGASLDPSVAKFILKTMQQRQPDEEPKKELSGRELEILALLGDGLVKKEIAEQLGISVTTVAYHIKHIYQKLEVQNAPSAVAKGYRSGLL
ncbi:response regulator transcription factor [Verrucomicrobiaceae bacterium 5K15]|uniref:Response regulator transcription factor n=1 Tax=Oceaniferula flava TaxID=2800421 RepID=A0AAE2SF40_9BACT|nr:response regulator transcription factor [Oceaniferula flavus]MBK1855842.1 response regulator transcription factor [Oceaniferula flavus]MBM1137149.1 response regulator transcription factor [Oceaniferula flavus]